MTTHSVGGEQPLRFTASAGLGVRAASSTLHEPRALAPDANGRPLHAVPTPRARTGWQAGYQARIRLTDVAVVCATLATALGLQLVVDGGALRAPADLTVHTTAAALLAVVWLAALATNRAYDVRFFGRGMSEYQRVLDATWKAFSLVVLLAWVTAYSDARGALLVAFPLGMVGLVAARYAWRQHLLRQRRRGDGGLTILLAIGDRPQAGRLIRLLNGTPEQEFLVAGVCVPSGGVRPGEHVSGVPVLGDLSDVGRVAHRLGADAVAVSSSHEITAEDVRRLGWELERYGVDLMLTAELADVAVPRITVSPAPGMSLLHVDMPRFGGPKFSVKQVMDWSLAAVITALASPVLLAIAVVVAATSRGPVFYVAHRVGRNGQLFPMVKFRTMHVGADSDVVALSASNEGAGPLFKMRSDPRVTPVGRFLRRYSLDELPQLFNVLGGHMSLVGPRPPLPHEVAAYEERMRRRLLVKPGMTGLWQVTGRSDLSWEEAVRLDVYYAENWTPFLDLLILAQTARAVVSGRGAY
ncbi:sugar transferase [Promicromonospora sp. NPDC050880]|uniref:sugar transferase n=1 Tax=Promicromonospora sp. NPDC050880 TaxID=3364406 RepID=UPI00378734EA